MEVLPLMCFAALANGNRNAVAFPTKLKDESASSRT